MAAKALRNYEIVYNQPEGSAKIEEVQATEEGIEGFAYLRPEDIEYMIETEKQGLTPTEGAQEGISMRSISEDKNEEQTGEGH